MKNWSWEKYLSVTEADQKKCRRIAIFWGIILLLFGGLCVDSISHIILFLVICSLVLLALFVIFSVIWWGFIAKPKDGVK